MIFGSPDRFAIEVGPSERLGDGAFRHCVPFRFSIGSQPLGDWEDRIALYSSLAEMQEFCDHEPYRRGTLFGDAPAEDVFRDVYDASFQQDCFATSSFQPPLRARYHLDGVGQGAVMDRLGFVVVGATAETERLLAKDLRENRVVADLPLPVGYVASVGAAYVAWGLDYLLVAAPDLFDLWRQRRSGVTRTRSARDS